MDLCGCALLLVVRIWDVRPYCASPERLLKTLMGHQHAFEKVREPLVCVCVYRRSLYIEWTRSRPQRITSVCTLLFMRLACTVPVLCVQNLLRCAWSHDGRYVTCGSGDRYCTCIVLYCCSLTTIDSRSTLLSVCVVLY